MYHAKERAKPQIRQSELSGSQKIHRILTSTRSQKKLAKKTKTNIVKETSNYLGVETQYFASQKVFIFRGVKN